MVILFVKFTHKELIQYIPERIKYPRCQCEVRIKGTHCFKRIHLAFIKKWVCYDECAESVVLLECCCYSKVPHSECELHIVLIRE